MPTQKEKLVRVEHPKTGRRYAVSEHDYKHAKPAHLAGHTYLEAGYNIISYEDGTEYKEGNSPTAYALDNRVGAPAIGDGGSNPTDVDGNKAGPDLIAATGVTLAETQKRSEAPSAKPPVEHGTPS